MVLVFGLSSRWRQNQTFYTVTFKNVKSDIFETATAPSAVYSRLLD